MASWPLWCLILSPSITRFVIKSDLFSIFGTFENLHFPLVFISSMIAVPATTALSFP
jgi:hypothetical protein